MVSEGGELSLDAAMAELSHLAAQAVEHKDESLIGSTSAANVVLGFLIEASRDYAADAFLRLIHTLKNRDDAPINSAEAYLRTVLRSSQLDDLRRTSREGAAVDVETLLEAGQSTLFGSPTPFDGDEAVEALASVLRRAAAENEPKLVQCAAAWLDLAEELDRNPTSREVGQRLGVSHQTVLNRLDQLRGFL